MGYIRKYTTLLLLLFLVITLGAFAGSAVFYQRSFKSLNDGLNERNENIRGLEVVLLSLQENYSRIDEMLQVTSQKKEDLSEQYVEIKGEKEDLEDLRRILEFNTMTISSDLNETKIDLEDAKTEVSKQEATIIRLENRTAELEGELDDVLDDIIDVCKDAEELNISKCGDYLNETN